MRTQLFCTRCEVPICPNCMQSSPTGYRCEDCGKKIRVPTFVVSKTTMWKAFSVAAVLGFAIGLGLHALNLVLINSSIPSVLHFYLFLGGLSLGGLIVGEIVSHTTNRKKGWSLRISVAFSIIVAIMTLTILAELNILWFVNLHIVLAVLVGYFLGSSRV